MKSEPPTLWAQYLRGVNGQLVVLDSHFEMFGHLHDLVWRHPNALYHLHLGTYQTRQQATAIVEGAVYKVYGDRQDDQLGNRVASGTLAEMLELLQVYASLLT